MLLGFVTVHTVACIHSEQQNNPTSAEPQCRCLCYYEQEERNSGIASLQENPVVGTPVIGTFSL